VLETLSPAERTAWVLHDLFRLEFPEVAAIVGRTPAAVRQLATRARRHVAAGTPRIGVGGVDGGLITRGDLVPAPAKLAECRPPGSAP
jgi:RNA polymerase sigma-70 factor (ECF subfamily)